MRLKNVLYTGILSLAVIAILFSSEVTYAQEIPYLQWAYRSGTRFDDEGRQIKVDAAGNVYTVGSYRSSVDFDPSSAVFVLSNSGSYDAFITKFSPSGNFIWAKKFGGTDNDYAYDLTFDGSGNILITGFFDETADFDPDPVDVFNLTATAGGMFVVKLDTNGDFIWATAVERANVQSIAVDNTGNVYTTGSYSGTADFNPGSGSFPLTSSGGADIFIQKLNASGNFILAIAIGSTAADIGVEIVFSPLNEIYLTGYFSGSFDFNPGTGTANLNTVGQADIFLSKWDTNLNLNWVNSFGAAFADRPYTAAIDALGNIYMSGYFQNTIDFDPGTGTSNLISAGSSDIFVTKYDALGNLLLAKRLGGTGSEVVYGIDVDISNKIYLTGSFSGTADFDPSTSTTFNLFASGSSDIFVSKLDATGNFVWAVRAGAVNSENGNSIDVSAAGDIYTTGLFRNTVDFDFGSAQLNLTSPQNISGSNDTDIFFQKISTTPSLFIYTQPLSSSICAGGSTSFTVLGTGTAGITYQWQWFNGTSFIDLTNGILNGTNYSGVTTTQLSLTNVTIASAGDYRCRISGNLVTPVFSNTVTVSLTSIPSPPTTLGASICTGGEATLSAFGTSNGNYLWYTVPTGGSPISDENESEYRASTITATFLTTTTWYVVITNGACESSRTPVTATVNSYTPSATELAALTAFYNATDGPNWNDNSNWFSPDLSTWHGITLDGCKISEIELSTNNLIGTIPPEIGDLTDLTSLTLAENGLTGNLPIEITNLVNLKTFSVFGNGLTGSIPTQIGLLTQLETLELASNQFTGTIPSQIGNLPLLSYLEISDNQFTGAVPNSFANLSNLSSFFLRGNQLSSLPDFSGSPNLLQLSAEDNAFTFEDLEPNMAQNFGFNYDPQANIPGGSATVNLGGPLTIPFVTGGTANQYQWYKEGVLIPGATTQQFTLPSAALSDAGYYTVEVTNTIVSGLILYSLDFVVSVNDQCGPRIDGMLDIPFNPNVTDLVGFTAVERQSDGKIIVAAPSVTINGIIQEGLIRFNTDGSLDNSFNPILLYPVAHEMKVLSNDKILVIEPATPALIRRYNADGTLDGSFNGPAAYTEIHALGEQSDGSILTAANNGSEIFIRLDATGNIDPTFSPALTFTPLAIKQQSDGKILYAGYNGIARFELNGTLDAGFASAGQIFADDAIRDFALQPDGKIIIVGDFLDLDGTPINRIARLNADGSLDTSFDAGTSVDGSVTSIHVLPNGKIIIGGNFSTYNGKQRPGLARLNVDGSEDCSFTVGFGFNGNVNDLVIQTDNKVLVAGDFSSFDGSLRNALVRVNNSASCVPTGERNALFDFYTSTQGNSWINKTNWLGGDESSWFGVTVNACRVTNIVMPANGLAGTLPASLSDITDLQILDVSGNSLSGNVPLSIGTMTDLSVVKLNSNQFTSIPDFISSSLTSLWVQNNRLHFGHLEPNAGLADFQVSPQANLSGGVVNITEGSVLTIPFSTPGSANLYQWSKGGVPIAGATSPQYSKTNASLADADNYTVVVTNSLVTGLTLTSNNYVVSVSCSAPSAPTTTDVARCGDGAVSLLASGASGSLAYRWYTAATGGTAISGAVTDTYTTPTLSNTTDYYVAITNGTCESLRTKVTAQINTPPVAPTAIAALSCGAGATVVVNASGGTNGEYRWYNVATNGTALAGETNSAYTTPPLSTSTTYYVALNNGSCESLRTPVIATINTPPASPAGTDASSCIPTSLTVSASGATNGQYRWYTLATNGTAIAGETNGSYTTPTIGSTTTYFVAINDGSCESSRTPVTATINAPPSAPSTTGASGCAPASLTLNASGGTNGQYRWYTAATGGTALLGETNSSYSTPSLTNATTYYVSINNGVCESTRTSVVANVTACSTNQPPVIQTTSVTTVINGSVNLNLLDLISDPDNNIDLTKLVIISQPISGAIASIDASQSLVIDYSSVAFTGTDELTIEVCDLAGSCVQQKISIEVEGDIFIYNGISNNGDSQNAIFEIKNIEVIAEMKENRVSIYNRWGSKVFEVENYNNTTRIFTGLNTNGDELPSGTYFYKIEFNSGLTSQTGYLTLKH